MKRPGTVLLAACVLAVSACSATLVETRKKVKGPVDEVGLIDAGGGHLKYPLHGWEWTVRSRRKDAFAQMAAYCGGEDKYKIVDEVMRDEVEANVHPEELEDSVGAKSRHYATNPYQHLFFECLK